MQAQPSGPLAEFGQRFAAYLPTLVAGIFILALGLVVGWVLKRVVVRVLIWLRLDRLSGKVAWRAAFGRGDVRGALYNLLGNVAMVLVVLVFLNNALDIWGLTVLSGIIERLNTYLPNLALVALIIGVGLFLSNQISARVVQALEEEEAPRPQLAAKVVKAAILTLVSAIALWQLNLARQLVMAAFLISFGAIGISFALAVGLGSANAIQRGWTAMFERRKDS